MHCNSTSRHIAYHHRDKENRYLIRLFVELCYFLFGHVKTADTNTDYNASLKWINVLEIRAGHFKSLLCRANSELSKSIHSLCFFFIYILSAVKILDSADYLYRKIFGIKLVNIRQAVLVSLDISPKFLYVLAKRVYCTHTCDNNSSHLNTP